MLLSNRVFDISMMALVVISLIAVSCPVLGEVYGDDDVLTVYPGYSYDFDIWNTSPTDYMYWGTIDSGGTAWDGEQILADWSYYAYVPQNGITSVSNKDSAMYLGPGLCVYLSSYKHSSTSVVVEQGYDCYSLH